MTYRSQRSETGVCSRRWSRRMAAFSWTGSRFRAFLDMGAPPLEVVAYSSRRLVPFQLKQNRFPFIGLSGEDRKSLLVWAQESRKPISVLEGFARRLQSDLGNRLLAWE